MILNFQFIIISGCRVPLFYFSIIYENDFEKLDPGIVNVSIFE